MIARNILNESTVVSPNFQFYVPHYPITYAYSCVPLFNAIINVRFKKSYISIETENERRYDIEFILTIKSSDPSVLMLYGCTAKKLGGIIKPKNVNCFRKIIKLLITALADRRNLLEKICPKGEITRIS